jgi:Zn-dependent protease
MNVGTWLWRKRKGCRVSAIELYPIHGLVRYSDPVLNVMLGILGYYNLFIAAFNLPPMRPLDGAKAWFVFSRWIKRKEQSPARRESGRRSYR